MKVILKGIGIFIVLSGLFPQEIPNEFYEYKIQKSYFDAGLNWERNSTFGPIRFQNNNKKVDSLIINSRFGTILSSKPVAIYGFGHFTFNSHFHGYLYSRVVNNSYMFERFSGIPMENERGGFTSGETDISGISFENEWMIFQFGRGRQSWGAGNNIQLSLSEISNAYDYGMLDLDFNKLRVRYFHGYLETDSSQYNRYITGRGIEWNNNKNLLFGLSEIVVYSGLNRPMDLAYFNPISTHLEIELNERQNTKGSDNGNGVWQGSFDYKSETGIRMSANYLFDEFVIDKSQKNEGKGHGNAYSFKFLYSALNSPNMLSSIFLSIISIGSNTFKHEDGNNNFVHRNKPLGWENGSDSREIKIGINVISKIEKYYVSIETGRIEIGEKNIINSQSLYDGYKDYLSTKFPSGEVRVKYFNKFDIQLWLKPYFSLFSELKLSRFSKTKFKKEFKIGFDVFFPIFKKI